MTKRSIIHVNFQDLDFCEANASWIVPQAHQLFKNIVIPVQGPSGLYSFSLTADNLRSRVERDLVYWEPNGHWQTQLTLSQLRDVMKWALQAPRGSLLGKTIKQAQHPDYSAIQPFGLWPALQERNQTWSDWDLTDPGASYWLCQDLLQALQAGRTLGSEFKDPDTRLAWRNQALEIRTGSKAGSTRQPTTTATVYNCPEISKLPRLLKLQLLELWLYSSGHYGIPFCKLEPLVLQNQPTLEVLVKPAAEVSGLAW